MKTIHRLQIYQDECVKASASFIYNLMVAVVTTGILAPVVSWVLGAADVNRATSTGIIFWLPILGTFMAALLYVAAEKTLEGLKR